MNGAMPAPLCRSVHQSQLAQRLLQKTLVSRVLVEQADRPDLFGADVEVEVFGKVAVGDVGGPAAGDGVAGDDVVQMG